MKFGIPKKSKTPKAKRHKEYRHPMSRSMHGQNLRVNIKMVDADHYETSEYWTTLNGESLMAMGYLPAEDYKRDFKDMFTKVYVKFEGFRMLPCVRRNVQGEMEEVRSLETANTLYEYFLSDAEKEFMESMRAKTFSSMSSKQLIFYAILGVGIIVGGFLISRGV